MNKWTPKTTLIVAGVAVVGVWYFQRKARETVVEAGKAINPTNHDNIFNRGAQALWDSVTDGQGTIGTDIYDWVHGE